MRRWPMGLVVGATLAMGASPMPSAGPSTPEIDLRPSVVSAGPASLASAAAFADSLDTGISLVRVRIVDSLDVSITLASDTGIVLAGPPELCLAWVYAAPDDAGLVSPCWGVPDPSAELASLMARDDGSWALEPGQDVTVRLRMARGGGRCDFPPGDWVLWVKMVPLADGVAQDPTYAQTTFEVPYDPTEVPTRLPLTETLFCGLASQVIREQGSPPTAAP